MIHMRNSCAPCEKKDLQSGEAHRLRLQHWPLWVHLLVLTVVLLVCVLAAITWGSAHIQASDVWRIVCHEASAALGWRNADEALGSDERIVWLIRMPRVLLAALVGAGLAVVGVTMQAMVRNPLADPYLLGVSSGASVGAVSVLAFGTFGVLAASGVLALSIGAFVGALAATALVFALALQRGRIVPTRLILSGVAVGYTLAGVTSFITMTSGQRDLANALMTWSLGSFSGTQWRTLLTPSLVLLACMGCLLIHARDLNAMLTGDETAATMGLDVDRLRMRLFVLVALLTGSMVAVSGAIGFVGLVIPHITRMWVGSNHRRVLPMAMFLGASFLVLIDLLARTLLSPMEIPVGVITSLVGGPFFVWMLLKRRTQEYPA